MRSAPKLCLLCVWTTTRFLHIPFMPFNRIKQDKSKTNEQGGFLCFLSVKIMQKKNTHTWIVGVFSPFIFPHNTWFPLAHTINSVCVCECLCLLVSFVLNLIRMWREREREKKAARNKRFYFRGWVRASERACARASKNYIKYRRKFAKTMIARVEMRIVSNIRT